MRKVVGEHGPHADIDFVTKLLVRMVDAEARPAVDALPSSIRSSVNLLVRTGEWPSWGGLERSQIPMMTLLNLQVLHGNPFKPHVWLCLLVQPSGCRVPRVLGWGARGVPRSVRPPHRLQVSGQHTCLLLSIESIPALCRCFNLYSTASKGSYCPGSLTSAERGCRSSCQPLHLRPVPA